MDEQVDALPERFARVLGEYERYLTAERNLTPHTVRAYTADVAGLLEHAARLGIPLPELRGAVRRSTGEGVKEYLLGIRLSRAKELLARTDLPVAGVARRVGYEDPAYFSRLFSRRVGMAPVRFRAQQSARSPVR